MPSEGIKAAVALSEMGPAAVIGCAQQDQRAVLFAHKLGDDILAALEGGVSPTSLYVMVAAALGFAQGGSADVRKRDAGIAADYLTTALVNILRFSAEEGFKSTAKEFANVGRTSD